jgi:predicted ATP-binding protein involved in virulence
MAIIDIHNELLDLLIQYHDRNPDFRFRPRKTNRSNRLAEGYWFLGNTEYLAVGFWTGNDWRTKLPNISFMVDYEGSCWLHFSATDTDEKFVFILNKIFPALDIIIREKDFLEKGGRFNINFKGKNLEECFSEFLSDYWPKIDAIVKKHSNENDLIGIIDIEIFIKDLQKILYYRRNSEQIENEINYIKPSRLIGFEIKNYRSIKHLNLEHIPVKSQWIFLTGENGVGKSNILKAIAKTIGFGKIEENESSKIKDFSCELFLTSKSEENQNYLRLANDQTGRIKPLLIGFAAYGPFRLNPIHGGLSANQLQEARSKNGNYNTLFSDKAYLLDLETQFKEWYDLSNNQDFAELTYSIKEFLEGLLLNVGKVQLGVKVEGILTTFFHEKDGENKLFEPVTIDKLSSGYMSILAMMSDIVVRLCRQQPNITDLGELRGTVLIDEIDIHLHPKFQKHFVEQLTATFPKVQFVATTHSPIPLLGAPKNSVICVVKRNLEHGTYIDRIDDEIILEDMLPNAILSSPIFGFKNLFPVSHDKNKKIRTEDNFDELIKNDELKSKLKEIAINLRNK